MIAELRERGLIRFLRDYITPDAHGRMRSLRKLLLGMGIVPVRPRPRIDPLHPGPRPEPSREVTRADCQQGSLRDPRTPDIALLPFAKMALSRVLRRRHRAVSQILDQPMACMPNCKMKVDSSWMIPSRCSIFTSSGSIPRSSSRSCIALGLQSSSYCEVVTVLSKGARSQSRFTQAISLLAPAIVGSSFWKTRVW
jgi:hypothetical protein